MLACSGPDSPHRQPQVECGLIVDEFGWGVVGSVAGVAGTAATIIFGLLPYLRARRARRPNHHRLDGAPKATRVFLPPPVLNVTVHDREDVVERLSGAMFTPGGRVQVLAGLGGSGKSTVAQAVAARIMERGDRVWWVSAGDALSTQNLLLGLANELGAPPGRVKDALAGRVNPSDVLWQQLEASSGWTLVLDNADDPQALKVGDRVAASGAGWLRSTRAGLVLVTSRRADREAWGPVAVVDRLGSLQDDDGGQLLIDLAPHAGELGEARSLSRRLGGLPLALHNAGSYLASPFAAESSFAEYERVLKDRFGELMGRGDDDRSRVTATWGLSLEALQEHGRGQAQALLGVLSCFAGMVPIPPLLLDRLILAQTCGTLTEVEEGLSGLLSVGLIDILNQGDPTPLVVVHPLVAETTLHLESATVAQSLAIAAELLAAAAGKLDPGDPHDTDSWFALLPHLRSVQSIDSLLSNEAEASLALATARVSEALLNSGSYLTALAVGESGLEHARNTLVNDHPALLQLRSSRAGAWEFMGRWPDAEAEYRHILADQMRIHGSDHPETLMSRHNMAFVMHRQGRSAEAEAEYRQLLDDQSRVLGVDHPGTLFSRHNTAAALARQGKYAEAEAEYRQVLAGWLRTVGPDHPSTLSTRNEIGRTLARSGKAAEAEAEYRQLLADRLRILGPDHPSTLTTRHGIGLALARQGKSAEAEAEYRQLLPDQMRIMGSEHPYTLTIRQDLAAALADQGKAAAAELEYRQVLEKQLQVLRPGHPDIALTRAGLERLHRASGK
jgi:tetratricopeptide (TPR) repeat protein